MPREARRAGGLAGPNLLVRRSRSRTVTGLLLAAPEFRPCHGPGMLEDKNWSDNRQVDGLSDGPRWMALIPQGVIF